MLTPPASPRQQRLGWAAALLVLVVAALAAAGSPGRLRLGDPAWWLVTALIVIAVTVLGWAAVVLLRRHDSVKVRVKGPRRTVDRAALLTALVVALVVVGLVWAMAVALGAAAGTRPPSLPQQPRVTQATPPSGPSTGPSLHVDLRPWLVVAAGLAILALLVWVLVHRVRSLPAPVEEVELLPPDGALIAAIDAALVDLDGERDPRRAVIKAYARTETVLRAHGLPRRPAEAPLEYLDRVLRELGGQAAAVDRLTVLFERAAFSRHEVGPEMRDEAVAAFHGLRANLAATARDGG